MVNGILLLWVDGYGLLILRFLSFVSFWLLVVIMFVICRRRVDGFVGEVVENVLNVLVVFLIVVLS